MKLAKHLEAGQDFMRLIVAQPCTVCNTPLPQKYMELLRYSILTNGI